MQVSPEGARRITTDYFLDKGPGVPEPIEKRNNVVCEITKNIFPGHGVKRVLNEGVKGAGAEMKDGERRSVTQFYLQKKDAFKAFRPL